MKLPRSLLIVVAVVALVAVACVALALTPAVQTWVVRKALDRQPGMHADVARIAVGLNSVRVQDLRLRQSGIGLLVPSLEVDLPVLSAARERVSIKRLVAKGWTLDLTVPADATTGASLDTPARHALASEFSLLASAHAQTVPGAVPSTLFSGLFEALQLPVDLSIDSAELEGDVIFPTNPGQAPGRAHVTITGGQLGAGREGQFTIVASAELSDPTAPVRTLSVRTVLGAHMDTSRTFSKMNVVSAAKASGPQLPAGAELNIDATAARTSNGEEYTALLRTPAKTLTDIKASFPLAGTRLDGTWKLDLRDHDVAPFALGWRLPQFALRGAGRFALEQALPEVQVAGQLDATLERLSVLHAPLRVIGALKFAADFDVVQRGDVTRITRLQAQVTGKEPVASLQALQGFEFNGVTGELSVANPDTDLLRVKLHGIPVTWAEPFLPGYKLSGDALRGELTAAARDGGFALHPTTPLTVSGLTVSQAGQPIVQAVDVSLRIAADYTPSGWQAEIGEFALRSGGVALLTLQAKAGQQSGAGKPLIATGNYAVDLPALFAQPIAQGQVALARGRASGEFTASLNEKQELATKLTLSDLASGSEMSLPGLTLDARVDVLPDGRIDARAPLVMTQNGRLSDLLIAVHARPAGEGLALDAQVTSEVLYVEDLQLFASATSAQEAPPARPTPPADQPVWAGVTGQLAFNLKKVVYSPTFTASDIAGTVKIGPAALTLENVRALLGDGGALKVAGGLDFEAKAAERYSLHADVSLTDVDPAPIFRSLNPAKPAPVEGRFDLTTRLTGRAADPAGLGRAALGDVKLTSRGGTLRALGVTVPEVAGTVGKVAEIAGGVASLFGKDIGATRNVKKGLAAVEVAKQLGAIPFDQLNIVLARDTANNFAIKDLTMISPLVRMVGSGQITYEPGVSVWRQPLLLNLQLGARDQLAENLRTLRLLGETSDPLGYAPLIEQLRVDGSIQSIGSGHLQNLINRALAN